jgi:hypothetical protein
MSLASTPNVICNSKIVTQSWSLSCFSLSLVRSGINILVILCTHTSYLSDHRLHVEHQFIELIYKAMILFKNIRPYMPELEGECYRNYAGH